MTTDKIEVTIRIDKNEARSLGEVVGDLKSQGLEQVQSHERFMIVNGTVNPDALDALRAVKESLRFGKMPHTRLKQTDHAGGTAYAQALSRKSRLRPRMLSLSVGHPAVTYAALEPIADGWASSLTRTFAPAVEEAGFCPVINRPSVMVKLCQFGAFS